MLFNLLRLIVVLLIHGVESKQNPMALSCQMLFHMINSKPEALIPQTLCTPKHHKNKTTLVICRIESIAIVCCVTTVWCLNLIIKLCLDRKWTMLKAKYLDVHDCKCI